MAIMKIGNLTRTLALLSAGALLGIFLLTPLSAGADHDPAERPARVVSPPTFVLEATNGQNFTFQLVENGDGMMEFINVPQNIFLPKIVDNE